MESIHERLIGVMREEFSDMLDGDPELLYDGVKARLKGGVELSVIYPTEREYLFSWKRGGVVSRIDTAPVHKGISSHPRHFHDGGEVKEDMLTDPLKSPEDNLRAVVRFLLG